MRHRTRSSALTLAGTLAAGTLATGLFAATAFLSPAAAQTARPSTRSSTVLQRNQLQQAERSRAQAESQAREVAERARAGAAEEARLAGASIEAAGRLQQVETELAARAGEVSDLAGRRAAAEARLKQHATALSPLLPLVERLALFPAETLLAVPAPPERTLRGLGVLHGLARRMETEARALRQEQADLDSQTTALEAAMPALRAAQAKQAEQAQALDQQMATVRALRDQLDEAGADAQRRAAAEAARADTLRGALAALEQSRERSEAQARDDAVRAEREQREGAAGEARRREAAFARPAGPGPEPGTQLHAPVAGAVVRNWGESTDAGPAAGISYRPAPQARVLAPCGGRVRFAGPFRSYGALVILDCGGGYAFVLAGLERLDVAVGVVVRVGEPIGVMPAWDALAPGSRPVLYLELRHDGQAVNPAPYLRARG